MSECFEPDSTHIFYLKEDKVPTIHFWEDIMGFKCSLRIDKPEYVNNLEGEAELTDEADMDFIISFLKSKSIEFPEISIYELARRSWNLNSKNTIEYMEMPDYNILLK